MCYHQKRSNTKALEMIGLKVTGNSNYKDYYIFVKSHVLVSKVLLLVTFYLETLGTVRIF